MAKAVHIDVTQEESVKLVTTQMQQWFGRIDYCVNCAGVSSVLYHRSLSLNSDVSPYSLDPIPLVLVRLKYGLPSRWKVESMLTGWCLTM